MLGYSLKSTYERMRELGLTKSTCDFSRRWLGRGATYLRDYQHRDQRAMMRVPPKTIATLRAQLLNVAACVPASIADEIRSIVDGIDRDCRIADLLRRS